MQRIVAQIVLTATNIISKAFLQAYQQAKAGGGGAAARAGQAATTTARVDLGQARSILNIESRTPGKDEILRQFKKYYEANDPEKGGSFYVQSKVWNAKEALMTDLKARQAASAAGAAGGAGTGTDGAAKPEEKPLK